MAECGAIWYKNKDTGRRRNNREQVKDWGKMGMKGLGQDFRIWDLVSVRERAMCTKTWLAIAKSDQDRDMDQASQVYRTARVEKLAWVGVVMSLSGREGPFLTRPSAVLATGGLWDATV